MKRSGAVVCGLGGGRPHDAACWRAAVARRVAGAFFPRPRFRAA